MIRIDTDLELPPGIPEAIKAILDRIFEFDIVVVIKKLKKKRSLDSNAYYWALCTKLAKKIKVSNNFMHNTILRRYGTPALLDGQLIRSLLPDTEEAENELLEKEHYHYKPTSQVMVLADGESYRTYFMLKGSSWEDFTTEEMSRLIEGLISECKEVGMTDREIMTTTEKEKLLAFGVTL